MNKTRFSKNFSPNRKLSTKKLSTSRISLSRPNFVPGSRRYYALAYVGLNDPSIAAVSYDPNIKKITGAYGAKPWWIDGQNGNYKAVAFSPDSTAIAFTNGSDLTVYRWSNQTGFGTFSESLAVLSGGGTSVRFSPDSSIVVTTHSSSPFVSAFPWSNATGIGVKYSNPATLPVTAGNDAAFSPDGSVIAVACGGSPYVRAYPWSNVTGFGTAYSNPATLPGVTGNGIEFSPDGSVIAVATGSTPFITAYSWSNATGFGTKYSNPATLPGTNAVSVSFSPASNVLLVGSFESPWVTAYPWSNATGFGTKYADPDSTPLVVGQSGGPARFSPDGSAVALATAAIPGIMVWEWSNSTGFGNRINFVGPNQDTYDLAWSPASDSYNTYQDYLFAGVNTIIRGFPVTKDGPTNSSQTTIFSDTGQRPTGTINDLNMSPDGLVIAAAHGTTPFVTAVRFTSIGNPSSSGTYILGNKYSDPATLPGGTGNSVAFSPDGGAIAVAHNISPHITAYPWSNATGFGTKYSNPATLPTGTGNSVAFSPDGAAIAVAYNGTPFITAYPWSNATGFGTKYSDPATLPTGTGQSVAFSPDGAAIAVGHNISPFISAYPWSSATGFGTKYSDPATLPGGAVVDIAFSPDGTAIVCGHSSTPFITAYPWSSATGFGTKYTDPATLPGGNLKKVAFTSDGLAVYFVVDGGTGVNTVKRYEFSRATGFGSFLNLSGWSSLNDVNTLSLVIKRINS